MPTHEGRSGYRRVFHDRVFIVFCLAAVLPVFCIGTWVHLRVYITSFLGVPSSEWAYLLTLNAYCRAGAVPAVTPCRGEPMISRGVERAARVRHRRSAFAGPLWSLVILIVVLSLGETLLSPVASAEVADLAPEAVRGRYMGVWTVVWNGGAALGPAFGGWAMDNVGGRQAFVALLLVGLAGTVSFWRSRRAGGGARSRRRRPGRRRSARPGPPPVRLEVERVLQVARVLLLDDEDVLERAAQAVLLQHLGLGDALAVAGDGVELAVEILLQHDLGVGEMCASATSTPARRRGSRSGRPARWRARAPRWSGRPARP